MMTIPIVIAVGLLGMAMLMRGVHELRLEERQLAGQRALVLAEGGLAQAVINLRTPTDTTDDVTSRTLSGGTFQVDTPMTQLGPQRWQVVARGVSGTSQRAVESVFELQPQSVFQFPLFGEQQINISGNAITDSYDSRLGPYNDDASSPGYNAGHNGDIGTNATSPGGITVGGSIFVDGQLVVGPGVADPATVVTNYDPAFVTGGTDPPSDTQDVTSLPLTFPFTSVTVPQGLSCLDHTVSSQTVEVLSPGTYCYNNLVIQGNATFTASGQVTIYVTGYLNAQGNSTFGVAADPGQMVVLMPSSGGVVIEQGTLQGNTAFYGAVYAPDSEITISGNAEIYGSVVAQQVNVSGNAAIHYDEALGVSSQVTNLSRATLIAWWER
jgi:hypothetical protein